MDREPDTGPLNPRSRCEAEPRDGAGAPSFRRSGDRRRRGDDTSRGDAWLGECDGTHTGRCLSLSPDDPPQSAGTNVERDTPRGGSISCTAALRANALRRSGTSIRLLTHLQCLGSARKSYRTAGDWPPAARAAERRARSQPGRARVPRCLADAVHQTHVGLRPGLLTSADGDCSSRICKPRQELQFAESATGAALRAA